MRLSALTVFAALVAASPVAAQTASARAELRTASGEARGMATLTQVRGGVRVAADVRSVAPGEYAFHVHTAGRCDAPTFESAGPHWNPTGAQHGTKAKGGAHKGDLPNVRIGANGTGSVRQTIRGVTLTGGPNAMLDADGAAVILHAKADDYVSQPSGAAGERIACGVIAR